MDIIMGQLFDKLDLNNVYSVKVGEWSMVRYEYGDEGLYVLRGWSMGGMGFGLRVVREHFSEQSLRLLRGCHGWDVVSWNVVCHGWDVEVLYLGCRF